MGDTKGKGNIKGDRRGNGEYEWDGDRRGNGEYEWGGDRRGNGNSKDTVRKEENRKGKIREASCLIY